MVQREELENRHAMILQHAERVYGLLWEEMTGSIKEAIQRGIDVHTNGTPYERLVVCPPRTLTLTLKKESHLISVSGLRTPIELQLDVCSDNRVCLKRDGEETDIHDAAVLLLDPFLFPEFAS